jgi:hypothetical protein
MKIEELLGKKHMKMPGLSSSNPNSPKYVKTMATLLQRTGDTELISTLMYRAEGYARHVSQNPELADKYASIRQAYVKAVHDEDFIAAAKASQQYELLDTPRDATLMAGESKGGPIIGAPKGSQKDARLTPGTDDPSKYMRGGEWEAYREPQGVNSNAGKIAGGRKKGTTRTKNKKTSESVLPSGGPGASGDLVPRDPHATTIAMVKDTATANIAKAPKLAGSEAPTKFVKKQIKKSLDNRPGNVSDINEQVNRILSEAIPRVLPKDYSADYELRDDRDQDTIGVARINHGVIELLSVRNDIAEDFNGHVMSRLMTTIVRDADAANSNLAIALDDPSDQQHKRFLERFGFRGVGKNIMKRNAGSVTPPSVPAVRL